MAQSKFFSTPLRGGAEGAKIQAMTQTLTNELQRMNACTAAGLVYAPTHATADAGGCATQVASRSLVGNLFLDGYIRLANNKIYFADNAASYPSEVIDYRHPSNGTRFLLRQEDSTTFAVGWGGTGYGANTTQFGRGERIYIHGQPISISGDILAGQGGVPTTISGSTANSNYLSLTAAQSTQEGASIRLYGRNHEYDGRIYYYSLGSTANSEPAHVFHRRTVDGVNTPLMRLRNDGNMIVYGSGTTCYIGGGTANTACLSDRRLKRDVRVIDDALSKIVRLRGVSYRWNDLARPDDKERIHLGVIAQEVQEVFPEAVLEDEEDGRLSVSLAALVPGLIEAVKEQKNQFDELASRHGVVTERVNELVRHNDRQDGRILTLEGEIAAQRDHVRDLIADNDALRTNNEILRLEIYAINARLKEFAP